MLSCASAGHLTKRRLELACSCPSPLVVGPTIGRLIRDCATSTTTAPRFCRSCALANTTRSVPGKTSGRTWLTRFGTSSWRCGISSCAYLIAPRLGRWTDHVRSSLVASRRACARGRLDPTRHLGRSLDPLPTGPSRRGGTGDLEAFRGQPYSTTRRASRVIDPYYVWPFDDIDKSRTGVASAMWLANLPAVSPAAGRPRDEAMMSRRDRPSASD